MTEVPTSISCTCVSYSISCREYVFFANEVKSTPTGLPISVQSPNLPQFEKTKNYRLMLFKLLMQRSF